MIPFFRKIRKKMADDNQALKYVRYAIGEIVLVVIGILIALQINNWNKELQNKTLETKTLENLKIDLDLQLKIIEIQLNHEGYMLAKVDSCLMMINKKIEVSKLTNLLDSLSERQTFIANKVTFENLGVDGNTTIISNSDLQNEIVKYYQQLNYTRSVINNNNLYRINSQFGTFVVNNDLGFRLNQDGQLDQDYIISPEQRFTLKKQLDGRRYSSKNNVDKCLMQMESTKTLIQLIDKELGKR
jgi:hypothetical protein